MMELDNNLFQMTEQEIRDHISEYNDYALAHILKESGFTESFLREIRDYLGDDFILRQFSVTDNFYREIKNKRK